MQSIPLATVRTAVVEAGISKKPVGGRLAIIFPLGSGAGSGNGGRERTLRCGRSRGGGGVVVQKGIRLRRCGMDRRQQPDVRLPPEHCLFYLHRQLTNRNNKH